MSEEIINQEIIDEAKSIMKDKFPTMIEYFLEDAEMYINSIKDGLDNSDMEKVKSPAHTIKSSAHQMGAEKLSTIAAKVELLSKESIEDGKDHLDEIKSLYEELLISFSEVKPELEKLA